MDRDTRQDFIHSVHDAGLKKGIRVEVNQSGSSRVTFSFRRHLRGAKREAPPLMRITVPSALVGLFHDNIAGLAKLVISQALKETHGTEDRRPGGDPGYCP